MGRMAMDELAEKIKASLENPNGELWFPELTDALVARAWESLQRDTGLTPESYGTARVLSRCASAPRDIVRSLGTLSSAGCSTIVIEAVQLELACAYSKAAVSFYSKGEILNTTILPCIEDALAIINQVPSLMKSVAALVRSLHVIKPEDEDYDVSFSEPHIPFSIFVSVPGKRIPNDALRVAEAIVHEAMHLQLTLVERRIPLVKPTEKRYFSPWRTTHRPLVGVFHALYVFGVLERFLAQLTLSRCAEYLHYRRKEIRRQMNETRSFKDLQELTPVGSQLAECIAFAANIPLAV
jgi:hypothetical protein